LDHEDQGLRLKSEQPVMYDNLLAASAACRLSNTYWRMSLLDSLWTDSK
jgi:hypothetical protein